MDPEPHSPDEVNTDAQRKALDAMSADLLRKLNEMVTEQEQRAQAFSVLQHSTSHLPQMPTPAAPEPDHRAEPKADPVLPEPPRRKPRRNNNSPAPKPAEAPKPTPEPRQPAAIPPHKSPDPGKISEISGKTIFIVMLIIFCLLRACSD